MNRIAQAPVDPSYLRIPVNQTATMRLLLEVVQRGSTRWTSGVVHARKAEALALKFARRYATQLTPTQRARHKAGGAANATLVMAAAGAQSPLINWWLLVSPGDGPVVQQERLRECRAPREGLIYPDAVGEPRYVLDHVQHRREQGGGRRWTWCLARDRAADHRARLLELVRSHGRGVPRVDDLQAHLDALARMPMFHGIREQVKGLVALTRTSAAPSLAQRVRWPEALAIMNKRMLVYRRPEPMLLPELTARLAAVERMQRSVGDVIDGGDPHVDGASIGHVRDEAL